MFDISAFVCSLGRLLFRGLGVLFVAVAICIISATIFTFYHTVFPLVIDLDSVAGWVQLLLSSWMSFNLIFNYVMVVRTPAGTLNESLLGEEERKMAAHQEFVRMKRGEGFTLWCHHSDRPKPPRAHYCHVSGQLILKMDHFCPWVGQCVGHYNHRYFLLFLLYLWFSTGYACLCIGLHWLGVLVNPKADEAMLASESHVINLCFIVCIALVVAISCFLFWSGFLALSNQTTIEWLGNRQRAADAARQGKVFRNPFDMGIVDNLREVFGPRKRVFEMMLPCTEPLPSDGHHWRTRADRHGWNDAFVVDDAL
ncbi:putative ZDHHC-type palmitoyltransferase 4 [Diplonema papillatum]|nr:putative ZDHHC-type palmitoyltransferase 4 [Diplonema papillatum]